jgi:hypothetical protein
MPGRIAGLTDRRFGSTMGGMRIGVGFAVLAAASVAASMALAAPPPPAPLKIQTIAYGQLVTLNAKTPADVSGTPHVVVLSKPCGFGSFVTVATPNVAPDGTVRYSTGPTLNTSFRVLIADRQVVTLNVRVQPRITLIHSGRQYKVEVTTGNGAGLAGRVVSLEQKAANGRWKKVGSIKLKLTSRPDQIDAVAGGLGNARLSGRGPVRASLVATQAAPCFAPAASAPLR